MCIFCHPGQHGERPAEFNYLSKQFNETMDNSTKDQLRYSS